MWGPDRTNHGGKVHYEVCIEHIGGMDLILKPASTFPDRDRHRTVYNSHILKKRSDAGREILQDEQTMRDMFHGTCETVFYPLVKAAERHSQALDQFHEAVAQGGSA
jgi:hypothetical protein